MTQPLNNNILNISISVTGFQFLKSNYFGNLTKLGRCPPAPWVLSVCPARCSREADPGDPSSHLTRPFPPMNSGGWEALLALRSECSPKPEPRVLKYISKACGPFFWICLAPGNLLNPFLGGVCSFLWPPLTVGGSTPECLIDEPLIAGFADDLFQGVLWGRHYVHVCLKQASGMCPGVHQSNGPKRLHCQFLLLRSSGPPWVLTHSEALCKPLASIVYGFCQTNAR